MEGFDIVQIISNVGFPIAAAVALFWKLNQDQQRHKEESDNWSEAVNNNTRVMERLLDKLTGGTTNDGTGTSV